MNFASKIKYVYFDLDGTLLSSRDTISPANLVALKILQKNGIKIGIITGRSNYVVRQHAEQIQADLPIVAMNGALIFNSINRTIIQEAFLPPSASKLINQLLQRNIDLTLYGPEGVIGFKGRDLGHYHDLAYRMKVYFKPKYHWPMILKDDWSEKSQSNVYEISLVFHHLTQAEETEILKEIVPSDIAVFQSSSRMFNVVKKSISKGNALVWLAENNYIELDKTMVFGDDHNDVPMFEEVPYAVAMKNACDDVKKKAFISTDEPNTNNGIAKFIERYWK